MRISRHLGLRRWIAGVTVTGLTVAGLAAAPTALADTTVPTTFTYEAGAPVQPYTVPAGITQVTITADGGSGAAALGGVIAQPGGAGGPGGEVTATVPVTPGETLNVVVGGDAGADGNTCSGDDATSCGGPGAGAGGNSNNPSGGGGGGGASQVSDASDSPLVVAGGGGGGGGTLGGTCQESGGAGGAGGAAASNGTTAPTCTGSGSIGLGTSTGGGGGGAGTSTGGDAGTPGTSTGCVDNVTGGYGLPAVGAPGAEALISDYPDGEAQESGGAGGGGMFGGGSGGTGGYCGGEGDAFEAAGAGGGGGGSNFTAASATDVTVGTSGRSFGSDGQVTISYTETTPVITSPASGSILPAATVGQPYSTTITATGIPTPTFTATGLPPGLSIGADSGVISGIPTTTGTYTPAVTATNAAGTDTAAYTLTVSNAATTTVAGTPGPVPAGSAVTLTATVSPAPDVGTIAFTLDGSPVAACAAQPVDPSTGEATCAVTAPDIAGSYPVTAAYSGGDGYDPSTGTATLTVTAGPLASLMLSPLTATITAGGSQAYTATGLDQYGNSLGDVTAATTFTITGTGSCTGSTCTATAAGTYTITGTDASATGTATLTVTAGPLASLMLSPLTATITAGGSQAYTATGYDQYGNSLGDVTAATTFTITGTGSCTGSTCTAATAGTYTVEGTDASAKGTATLTVTAGPAATVTITGGDNQTAFTGQPFATPLSVTVTNAHGSPVPGAVVTFTIVAATGGTADFGDATQTITATTNSAGVATAPTLDAGISAGPVAVTATTPGASGTAGATFMETVITTGPARADLAISITAPATLPPGGAGTIIVTVTNKGPQTATGVLTLLSVPSGLTITSAGGGTLHHGIDLFTAPTLAAGAKLIYTVQVTAGTTRARVLLIASTGSATRDPRLFNNITTAFLTIT
jgi:hypothetical protein